MPLAAMFGLYLFFGKYHLHKSKESRWWKLLLGNVLVFVFAGSLVALLGEAYFRFWYDTTDSFELTKTSRRWFERYYHVNNIGVRDNQDYLSLSRAPGQRRITFVDQVHGQGIATGQLIGEVPSLHAHPTLGTIGIVRQPDHDQVRPPIAHQRIDGTPRRSRSGVGDRGHGTRAAAQRVAARDSNAAASEIECQDELWKTAVRVVRP